jgi:hypothetical protein
MACSGTPPCPFLTKEGFKSWDPVVDESENSFKPDPLSKGEYLFIKLI